MNWSGRKVLVTGAGGFLGSHLAERLTREGARVRALVRYNSAGRRGWLDHSDLREDLEVVAGDISDRDSVLRAMRGTDVVFHLAALIAIPYSYDAPFSYVGTNVSGTLNVLQAAREVGVEKVVHTSTSEVYGSACYTPMDEAHPLQAQSPYAASKIGADKLAEAFHLSFGLPVVTVRPFNTYGPRQSARAIIPSIIIQMGASPNLRIGNIHPTRDMNFVEDTVTGFLMAGTSREALGRTVNLGSGKEMSIGDLIKTIARIMDREVEIETEQARVRPEGSEVERLVADSSLAGELLGWRPQVDLEMGLAVTIQWYRKHMDLFRGDEYAL